MPSKQYSTHIHTANAKRYVSTLGMIFLLIVLSLMLISCGTEAAIAPNTPVPPTVTSIPAATATMPPTQAATSIPATLAPTQVAATRIPTQIPATTAPTQAPPSTAPTIVPTAIPATSAPAAPAASGGTILFLRNANLWAADAGGGNERQLAEGVSAMAPSANMQTIALIRGSARQSEIWLINRDGSGLRQLTKNDRAEAHLSWAADGSIIVTGSSASDRPYGREWLAWTQWCKLSEIRLIDVNSGAETTLAPGCDPAFAPDSKRIAYSAPPANRPNGYPENGPYVANSIRLMNRQGQNGWNFASADGNGSAGNGLVVYTPSWSPNGERVVYHRFMGNQIEADINLTEIGAAFEGKGSPMAEGGGWMLPALFSPQGESVALVENDYGNARGLIGYGAWAIEVIQLQGSRDLALPSGPITATGQERGRLKGAQAAAWSPAGTALAVLLPATWSAEADPQEWGELPGEIRIWTPGQTPGAALIKEVDYQSPVFWLN